MRLDHPDQLYELAVAQHQERLKQAMLAQSYLAEYPLRRSTLPALIRRIRHRIAAGGRRLHVYLAATVRGAGRAI